MHASAACSIKLACNQVPVLETPQGPLTESSAIARYLASLSVKRPLYPQPSDPSDTTRASIDAWIDWATSLDRITQHWVQPMFSTGSHKPSAVEAAQKDFDKSLQVLEAHLSSQIYLVGEGLTLADIVVVSHLLLLYICVSLPCTKTCVTLPSFLSCTSASFTLLTVCPLPVCMPNSACAQPSFTDMQV